MIYKYKSFPISVSKEKITEVLSPYTITFCNEVFDSYEEAESYIRNCNAGAGNYAVKYRYETDFKPSKYLSNLYERYNKALEEYKYADGKFLKNYSLASLVCPTCSSKLAFEYIRKSGSNICPVCRKDFRPLTTIARVMKKKETADILYQKMIDKEKEERLKSIKKAETFWLVGYDEKQERERNDITAPTK